MLAGQDVASLKGASGTQTQFELHPTSSIENSFDENVGTPSRLDPFVTHLKFHLQSSRQDDREVPPVAPFSQSVAQIRGFWTVVMRGRSLPESPKNLGGLARR